MNTDLITKALCFHGQPLQKIWAGERGDHDLYQLGITNPDFSLYLERQKSLTFHDRAKRLKLHQFLARKATELFDRGLQTVGINGTSDLASSCRQDVAETIVSMPPYEYFLNSSSQDKSKVLHCTLESVKPGTIVYGIATKPFNVSTQVKVLCTGEPLVRYLAGANIKALLPSSYMIPGHDKKGNPKNYGVGDFVCCEVLDISIDAERMTLGMKGIITKDTTAPLGLISPEQIPDYYRRIKTDSDNTFEDYLHSAKTFSNTNSFEMLYESVGLDINDNYSHMKSLKYRFPSQDYAIELRQTQASKWAFRSVADGIEHFKIGRHVEAFQCLNKALNTDPRNVEGLVARGALYANKGSFIKAVEDFETALKLNAFHTNARKYMGETLVALGRSYEEENHMEEAVKAYQNCLNIIPNHEQARISLDALKRRPGLLNPVFDINMLSIPVKPFTGTSELKKKKKSKHRSSSSSSSSADSSSSTENASSDDSSASDSETEKHKKKLRNQKSLSPLSKRMGDMNSGNLGLGFEFSQPFYMMQKEQQQQQPTDYNKMDDFLGADDDYQTRMQKLLKDASKHRKERDGKSSKKKSKKKRKKAKKDAKEKERKAKQDALTSFESIKSTDDANLTASLEKYERSLKELKTYQQLQQQQLPTVNDLFLDNEEEPPPAPSFTIKSATIASPRRSRRESPALVVPKAPSMANLPPSIISIRPPPAPISMKLTRPQTHLRSNFSSSAASFKPFPIKGPVVLDKFGCFRMVAPPPEEVAALSRLARSRSKSRSRRRLSNSRRRSRSRSRSRSNGRGRGRRRSRSPRNRRRSPSGGRRSPLRGRSRGLRRPRTRPLSRSRSRDHGRRTPSPFNPNRRPRSRSPMHRRGGKSPDRSGQGRFFKSNKKVFGNRVWQRPVDDDKESNGDRPSTSSATQKDSKSSEGSGVDGQWEHDKFVKEDGISLEEIDKIIIQAKKDRKEEILQRDKKILKKNAANTF